MLYYFWLWENKPPIKCACKWDQRQNQSQNFEEVSMFNMYGIFTNHKTPKHVRRHTTSGTCYRIILYYLSRWEFVDIVLWDKWPVLGPQNTFIVKLVPVIVTFFCLPYTTTKNIFLGCHVLICIVHLTEIIHSSQEWRNLHIKSLLLPHNIPCSCDATLLKSHN